MSKYDGWISVKDALPPPWEDVLIAKRFKGELIYSVCFTDSQQEFLDTDVEYWRPLPPFPGVMLTDPIKEADTDA